MSYQTIETGLVALLATVTGFTGTGAVRADDYEQMNAGVDKFITVVYEGFSQNRDTFGNHTIAWRFRVRVHHQMTDNIAVEGTIQSADRQAILTKLRQYPQLNNIDGVFDSWATEGGVDAEPRVLGDASFIREWLAVTVIEDVSGGELE